MLSKATPLVSFLMTVYNREKYIAEAIESVLASTYQNWELIIVDDQSKDRSVEIAKQFASEDDRIKVYINKVNLGDYPNRNKAASYAQGKYLKYLDADDIIYPHGLEVMVNAMEKFPQADFGTQYNVRECIQSPYPFLIETREAFIEHFFGNSYFQSGPTGTIFKKEAFDRLGGFSGRRHIGDTEMWMKFSIEGPFVVFQPSLIWWRKHEEQEIKYEQKNLLVNIQRLLFDIEQLNINKRLFNEREHLEAIKKKKQHLARYLLSIWIKKRYSGVFWEQFINTKLTFIELLKGFRNYSK